MPAESREGLRVVAGPGACRACGRVVRHVALFAVSADGRHAPYPARICADSVTYPAADRVVIVHHRCPEPADGP